MEAKELRIGNYLEVWIVGKPPINEGEFRKIDSSDIEMISGNWSSLVEFKPFKLTEEWLLKFGFKNYTFINELDEDKTDKGFRDPNNYFIIKMFKNGWGVLDMRTQTPLCYFNAGEDKRLKYVHQLQNFYFALTGKELQ